MPIKNFSTTIAVSKTMGEVHAVLVRRGVTRISTVFDDAGRAAGIEFTMKTDYGPREFALPVRSQGVLEAMKADPKVPRSQCTLEQAARVAWRIAKEWLEVQAALIDAQLATTDEVFLPWMLTGDAHGNAVTTYERYQSTQKALER